MPDIGNNKKRHGKRNPNPKGDSKDLSKLDPESREYWNEILRRSDLTMSQGLNAHKLVYVGTSKELTYVEELMDFSQSGRTGPASRSK